MGSEGTSRGFSGENDRRFSRVPPADINIHVHGATFQLNKRCMMSRSAKLAHILTQNSYPPISSYTFTDIPADPKIFSLAARFCHGIDTEITPSTVVPLACLAKFLEMTEDHYPNNLLQKTITYAVNNVLPYWNETIKAYRTIEPLLDGTRQIGLLNSLLDSIAQKVYLDPCLLRNPIENWTRADGEKKRRVIDEWCAEDLTSLSLKLFVMAIMAISHVGVAEEHVAQCLYRYVKKRASTPTIDALPTVYERSYKREVIEAMEKLMPTKKGVLPVKSLFHMLQSAMFLETSSDCRKRLEARISQQLAEANVEDLFHRSYKYTSETTHDIDCTTRILNQFCSNYHNTKNITTDELEMVMKLMEEFLCAVAKDPNLTKETFTSLLGMPASLEKYYTERNHDKVYHAVDLYFKSHSHMTEAERSDLCRLVDVGKMSMAACEHATLNPRLPMRFITLVLSISNARIRGSIVDAMMDVDRSTINNCREVIKKRENEKESEEEEVEERMEEEEEEECGGQMPLMVADASAGGDHHHHKRKRGFWKEMKSRFGCKESEEVHDCSCHGRKLKKMKKNVHHSQIN